MRATAAHSTLCVADTPSAHIVPGKWSAKLLGTRLIEGPTRVDAKRRESEDGIHIDASHDAYATPFGLIHERRWFVSHDGSDIRGEDKLTPRGADTAARRFVIRFHLHPTVKAVRMADGKAVVLTLLGGASWRFGSDAELEITDSVYLGAGDAIRKSHQIVITGETGPQPTAVKWAIKKIAGFEPDPAVN
jgi:uncharacterized heparinase superfamily protein